MRKVLVAPAADIVREYYMAAVVDRAARRILLMGSAEGGVEIEQVAADTPEAIVRHHADPMLGLLDYQAREFAFAMGLARHLKTAVAIAEGLVRTMVAYDADLVEINPLAIVRETDAAGARRRAAGLPRRQGHARRLRAAAPSRARGAARPGRGGPGRPRGARGGADVHQARRHDRLHGQRRGAGDDHDGPRQARRRRAGQLPRHRRRGAGGPGRGGDADHPRRPEGRTPSWSTSSAGSPAATRSPAG